MKLYLHFGALTKSVSEQIKEQLNYTDKNLEQFDKDADALVRVHVRSIITDGDVAKARIRLNKAIAKYLQKKIDSL